MSTHAYLFAHRALPLFVFTEPEKVLPILAGEDAQRFLNDTWENTGKQVEQDERRQPEGLSLTVSPTGKSGVVFAVELPAPEEPGEAFYVAIFGKFANLEEPDMSQLDWVRYFVLEKAIHPVSEQPCTMLCEWTADARHKNYGEGPAADESLFIESALEKMWNEVERAAVERAEQQQAQKEQAPAAEESKDKQ